MQWLKATYKAQQQKAGAATLKIMAPATEEPRVESPAGGQKEVQEGCQLGPMEVSRLEETAANTSMEPAIAVKCTMDDSRQLILMGYSGLHKDYRYSGCALRTPFHERLEVRRLHWTRKVYKQRTAFPRDNSRL